MTYTLATNGQYHFEKEVQLEADGSYQYKFRLGPGDWWVLDETAPVGMCFPSLHKYTSAIRSQVGLPLHLGEGVQYHERGDCSFVTVGAVMIE